MENIEKKITLASHPDIIVLEKKEPEADIKPEVTEAPKKPSKKKKKKKKEAEPKKEELSFSKNESPFKDSEGFGLMNKF